VDRRSRALARELLRERKRAMGDGAELARVAHERNVGHLFVGQTHRGRLWQLLHGSAVSRLLQLSPDLDVTVVAARRPK